MVYTEEENATLIRVLEHLDDLVKKQSPANTIKAAYDQLISILSGFDLLWGAVRNSMPYAVNYLVDHISSEQLKKSLQVPGGSKNILVVILEQMYQPSFMLSSDQVTQFKQAALKKINLGAVVDGNGHGNNVLMQTIYIAQAHPKGLGDYDLLKAVLAKLKAKGREHLLNDPDPTNNGRTPLGHAKFVLDRALVDFLRSQGASS